MKSIVRSSIFLARVWLLATALRLALWVLPFATVRRMVRRWSRRPPVDRDPRRLQPLAIARTVRRATRFVPGANCLTRALTVQVLLSRAGQFPRLRLGLMPRDGGELRAHAWVENHGEIVIGGGGLNRYVPLPLIEKP